MAFFLLNNVFRGVKLLTYVSGVFVPTIIHYNSQQLSEAPEVQGGCRSPKFSFTCSPFCSFMQGFYARKGHFCAMEMDIPMQSPCLFSLKFWPVGEDLSASPLSICCSAALKLWPGKDFPPKTKQVPRKRRTNNPANSSHPSNRCSCWWPSGCVSAARHPAFPLQESYALKGQLAKSHGAASK